MHKKIFTKTVLWLLLMLLFWMPTQAQDHQYGLYTNSHKIGAMQISGNTTQISIKSEVTLKFLAKATVSYTLKSTYGPKGLQYSKVVTYVNNKEHSLTEIKAIAEGYEMTKNDKKSTLKSLQTYTGAMLYVQEPLGVSQVFSESDGLMRKVTQIGPHHYRLDHPKKKSQSQEFKYKDGLLVSATIQHPFKSFQLKRE